MCNPKHSRNQYLPQKGTFAIKYAPSKETQKRTSNRPLISFAVLSGLLFFALYGSVATWFNSASFGVPLGLFALIVVLAFRGLHAGYPHDRLGACNAVTLIRAAMTAALTAAIFSDGSDRWMVFFAATLAFSLDGLDGWLARRSGLSSSFGARFDMEVDALLGAVLAMILLTHGHVGLEILVLGFTRYIFVAFSWILPKLNGALPQSFRRKTICVVQIAALILLLCPLTPVAVMHPLSISAALLLLWSFAVDTFWLLRRPS